MPKKKKSNVIDFKEAGKCVKEKRSKKGSKDKGKVERAGLLASMFDGSENEISITPQDFEAKKKTKTEVTEMIFNWGMKKPWFMELQLIKLYMGISPTEDRNTIESFKGEVKYMRKKVFDVRDEVKGSGMDKDERTPLQLRLTWFASALKRMEGYLAHLLDASDKDREKLMNTNKDDRSNDQSKIFSDRDEIEQRTGLLEGKVAHDKKVASKIRKIARAA